MSLQILLATYNGEKYLKTQLDSLFSQNYKDFEILASDDCSSDSTPAILSKYASLYPEKIHILKFDTPSGCAKNNFFRLMQNADADYIMFCDQDDFWLPDKIKLTMEKMKEIEKPEYPALVHTDLSVADKDLNITEKSFFRMQHFDKNMKLSTGKAIAQNTITGCTVMINKTLLNMAKNDNHESVIMHDWWLGILAAAFGTAGVVKTPTILYRQHGDNSVGAKTFSQSFNLHIQKKKSITESLDISYEQAMHFAETYKEKLPERDVKIIKKYSDLSPEHELSRLYVMIRYGFLKQSFIRKCVQILHCTLIAAKQVLKKILRKARQS